MGDVLFLIIMIVVGIALYKAHLDEKAQQQYHKERMKQLSMQGREDSMEAYFLESVIEADKKYGRRG